MSEPTEDLRRAEVSLFVSDIEWLNLTYGNTWTEAVGGLVRAQIKSIKTWARIDLLESKLTEERLAVTRS
jgi:hypothetical protein